MPEGGHDTASSPPAQVIRHGRGACRVSAVVLAQRISGASGHSASETAVYRMVKFLPLSARLILRAVESAAGFQRLIHLYGGTVIRVPLGRYSREIALVEVLGVRATDRFVRVYGGTEVYIPRCSAFLRHVRNVSIVRECTGLEKGGMSRRRAVQVLAVRHVLSAVRIRDIIKNFAREESVAP
ncbi:MAG: Mor transcription activator family protein [Desulfovibrionaceae bacterium]